MINCGRGRCRLANDQAEEQNDRQRPAPHTPHHPARKEQVRCGPFARRPHHGVRSVSHGSRPELDRRPSLYARCIGLCNRSRNGSQFSACRGCRGCDSIAGKDRGHGFRAGCWGRRVARKPTTRGAASAPATKIRRLNRMDCSSFFVVQPPNVGRSNCFVSTFSPWRWARARPPTRSRR